MNGRRCDLPDWESFELLGGETVGRLCVIDSGYPLAFPLNYRLVRTVDDTKIVFRTIPHAAVARYEGPASLEVDRIDAATAWSIIVRGELRRVVGPHQLPDTNPLLTEGRHQWMVLTVTSISGRRFTRRPDDSGFAVDWQPLQG